MMKHKFSLTDSQGHAMSCTRCGKHININEVEGWNKGLTEKCRITRRMKFNSWIWSHFLDLNQILPRPIWRFLYQKTFLQDFLFLLGSMCPYHLCRTEGGLDGWESRRVCPKCGVKYYWDMG